MTATYLDTSAAMKLIVDEDESAALTKALTSDTDRQLVASWLLHTELHCAAGRHPHDLSSDSIRRVLDVVTLVDLTRSDMVMGGTLAPLRSNDALHLAAAIRLDADELVTYDHELAAAAQRAGLDVLSPAA